MMKSRDLWAITLKEAKMVMFWRRRKIEVLIPTLVAIDLPDEAFHPEALTMARCDWATRGLPGHNYCVMTDWRFFESFETVRYKISQFKLREAIFIFDVSDVIG